MKVTEDFFQNYMSKICQKHFHCFHLFCTRILYIIMISMILLQTQLLIFPIKWKLRKQTYSFWNFISSIIKLSHLWQNKLNEAIDAKNQWHWRFVYITNLLFWFLLSFLFITPNYAIFNKCQPFYPYYAMLWTWTIFPSATFFYHFHF